MASSEQLLIQMIVRMQDETHAATQSVTANLRSLGGAADQAAGPFGRIAEIAAGIVTAQLLHRVADGISNTARAAIDAVGNYEALTFAVGSLLAKEERLNSAYDEVVSRTQTRVGLTAKEREQLEKLLDTRELLEAQIWRDEDALQRAIESGKKSEAQINYMRVALDAKKEKLNETTAAIERLMEKENSYVEVVKTTTQYSLSMADAQEAVKDKTKELLRWITQLAIKSPFSEQDIAYIVRIGMSYGMASETAKEMAQALANLGAATGLPSEQMRLLGLALGQVQARGYLTGEEMRQLTNAGIGVDYIARAMGISINQVADAIKAKKIAADELLPALFNIINSDFGGSAERMALSWNGLRSTINDLAQVTLRTLFGPALEELKPIVADFVSRMTDPNTIVQLSSLGERLGVFIVDALNKLKEVIGFVKEHWDAFSGAITGVGIALGALAVLGAVALAIGALTSPIGLVVLAAASLGAAWNSNWGGIRDKVDAVWIAIQPIFESVRTWLEVNLPAAFNTVRTWAEGAWGAIHAKVAEIWPLIQGIVDMAIVTIKDNVQIVIGGMRDFWRDNHDLIKETAQTVWNAIKDIVDIVLGGLWETVKTALGSIHDFWVQNHGLIEQTTTTVFNAISGIVEWTLGAILGFWKTHGDEVKRVVSNFMDAVKTAVETALELIKGVIVTAMQIINGDWDGAWGTIKDTAETVWNGIKQIVKDAIDNIKTDLGIVWDYIEPWVTGVWGRIKTSAESTWEGIKSAIVTPIEKAKEFIKTTMDLVQLALDSIKIPHIPTPHISVRWEDMPVIGRIPVGVDVQWYQHGLDAIIDRPTLIGVGEAGPERVVVTPLSRQRGGQAPGEDKAGNTYVMHYYAIRPESGRADAEEAMRRFEWAVRMSYG